MLSKALMYVTLLCILVSHEKLGYDPLDVEKFNRCSLFFKNQRAVSYEKGRIYLNRIRAGLNSGKSACKSLIMTSFRLKKGVGFGPLVQILDFSVYKGLLDLFVQNFNTLTFSDDNDLRGNYEVYDLDELGKLFVFNLLRSESLEAMFIGREQIVSIDEGLLLRTNNKDKVYRKDSGKKQAYGHIGGGVLGHALYLLQNLNIENDEIQSEKFSTRIYPNSFFKDFLCQNLPVLTLDDAYPFVVENHRMDLRRIPACMQCHASMDPITSVLSNVFEKEVVLDSGLKATVIKRVPSSLYKKNDYLSTHKTGHLRFRNNKGKYVDLYIKDINDLGLALGSQKDLYECFTKKISKTLGRSEYLDSVAEKFYKHRLTINLITDLI